MSEICSTLIHIAIVNLNPDEGHMKQTGIHVL